MEPVVESTQVKVCPVPFPFRMVSNKEMLYYHCFSTLL